MVVLELPGNGVSVASFLGAGISMVVLVALFVAIRLWNGLGYSKKLFADDYLAVFFVPLQAVNFWMYCQLSNNIASLTKPGASLHDFTQFLIAEAFIGGFAMYFAKVPVLVLLARLFGIRKMVKTTVWSTLAVGFAIFLASLMVVAIDCSASKIHNLPSVLVCTNSAARNGVIHGVASLVLDLIIFLIPLPIIMSLQLSTQKKIGLYVVFMAGIIAIIASTIALCYKIKSYIGNSDSDLGTYAMICSLVESSIAIIVGCVPSIRSLWSNQFTQLAVYTKIRSIFSSVGSSQVQSLQTSFERQPGISTEQFVESHSIKLHPRTSITGRSQDSTRPYPQY